MKYRLQMSTTSAHVRSRVPRGTTPPNGRGTRWSRGLLKNNSPRGIWEITEAGLRYLLDDPDQGGPKPATKSPS